MIKIEGGESIDTIFNDVDFQKILIGCIKTVKDTVINDKKVRANPYRTLCAREILTVPELRAHFKDILMKKSKLSSAERNAIMVLVQEAIVENNRVYSQATKK